MLKKKTENTLKVSEDFIRKTLKKNFHQKKIDAEALRDAAERLVDATTVSSPQKKAA